MGHIPRVRSIHSARSIVKNIGIRIYLASFSEAKNKDYLYCVCIWHLRKFSSADSTTDGYCCIRVRPHEASSSDQSIYKSITL
jgi:hypothetical protein